LQEAERLCNAFQPETPQLEKKKVMAENKDDKQRENDPLASKHTSGLDGKTGEAAHSGKNVQFNSGSGGAKGENYDGNSGPRNKPGQNDETGERASSQDQGQLSGRDNTGFGKNPRGEKD
jgi:hypothetical protein